MYNASLKSAMLNYSQTWQIHFLIVRTKFLDNYWTQCQR